MPFPAAGQVLVAVKAASVNLFDTQLRSGLYPRDLPFTLGLKAQASSRRSAPTSPNRGRRSGGLHLFGRQLCQPYAGAGGARGAAARQDRLRGSRGGAVPGPPITSPRRPTRWDRIRAASCIPPPAAAASCCARSPKFAAPEVIGAVSTPEKAAVAREAGADDVVVYAEEDFAAAVERITAAAASTSSTTRSGSTPTCAAWIGCGRAGCWRCTAKPAGSCRRSTRASCCSESLCFSPARGPDHYIARPARNAGAHRRIVRLGGGRPAEAKSLPQLPA